MSEISDSIVILTVGELKAKEKAAFQRGVERGKFEALSELSRRNEAGTVEAINVEIAALERRREELLAAEYEQAEYAGGGEVNDMSPHPFGGR